MAGWWSSGGKDVTSVICPNTVRKINKYAFAADSSNLYALALEKFVFGNKVEEIGNRAFAALKQLKEFILPNSLIKVDDGAFNEIGVTDFVLPASIKELGYFSSQFIETLTFENGFENIPQIGQCGELKTINIPDSVKTINADPFAYSMNIERVNYGGTMAKWKSYGSIQIGWSTQPNIYCIDGYIDESGVEHPNARTASVKTTRKI